MSELDKKVQKKLSWYINGPLDYGSKKCAKDIINICMDAAIHKTRVVFESNDNDDPVYCEEVEEAIESLKVQE